jgi:hypothetical protein
MSGRVAIRGYRALQTRLEDLLFAYAEAPFGAEGGDALHKEIGKARKALDRRMSALMQAAARVAKASKGKYGAADLVRALEDFEVQAPIIKARK